MPWTVATSKIWLQVRRGSCKVWGRRSTVNSGTVDVREWGVWMTCQEGLSGPCYSKQQKRRIVSLTPGLLNFNEIPTWFTWTLRLRSTALILLTQARALCLVDLEFHLPSVMSWIVAPQNSHVEALTPGHRNVIFLGNSIVSDVLS